MKYEIGKVPNASMAEILIVKHKSIMTSVQDVATASKIFLTLPVTSKCRQIIFKIEINRELFEEHHGPRKFVGTVSSKH